MNKTTTRTSSAEEPVESPRPAESTRQQQTDPVDEAAAESFPASDPPAFTGSTASPSEGKTERLKPRKSE